MPTTRRRRQTFFYLSTVRDLFLFLRAEDIDFATSDRLVESPRMKRAVEAVYTSILPKGASPFVYLRLVFALSCTGSRSKSNLSVLR